MRMLKKISMAIIAIFVVSFAVLSCKKDVKDGAAQPVSEDILTKISQLGFSNKNVTAHPEGYLVEGDIVITEQDLASPHESKFLRIGETEQYRTTNLVTGLPRKITVRVSTALPSSYVTATDEAIRRYNAEGLRMTFSRVTSGGNIVLSKAPAGAGYLASSGFPSGGNPYSSVLVNSSYLGSNPGTNYLGTILAHEIGHCIGFRHTDYADRSYSCGGSPVNEGASTVGAIYIPGTATGPDPGSWMLACIAGGVDRPFNANDKTALSYLYR